MAYKRYGGSFQFDGVGNAKANMVGLFIIVIGSVVTLMAADLSFLLMSFFIALVIAVFASLMLGDSVSTSQMKLRKQYIVEAYQALESEDNEMAVDRFKMVNRIKPLSDQDLQLYIAQVQAHKNRSVRTANPGANPN